MKRLVIFPTPPRSFPPKALQEEDRKTSRPSRLTGLQGQPPRPARCHLLSPLSLPPWHTLGALSQTCFSLASDKRPCQLVGLTGWAGMTSRAPNHHPRAGPLSPPRPAARLLFLCSILRREVFSKHQPHPFPPPGNSVLHSPSPPLKPTINMPFWSALPPKQRLRKVLCELLSSLTILFNLAAFSSLPASGSP